ncbi:biopolymer transporter ExbD [Vibrio parahaemolyticus]|jgi:biopolymer transport protein ExbD|uniref:Biopolymer transporter ExbD n=19 Tax=Vibrio TaxID=662 RepID=A0A072JY57_VIBPH|nr:MULTISPECIES: biopolymer transporter ExbD [Vibrio]EFO36733.1 TonB system transport protein ExbD1 [Vibrio parahaemolyticus Peru-466]EFO45308.1 TonB system transport protein ExbD1 [Vibrio parahaemolyticus AQ4037]EFO51217.1 TonB system transport protein ExbD1 [Vibrio parahaemolyticus K5030]EJG0764245.1 biopolymer transporter ExbD [Vibrio parahaemolyticus O5:K30]EJG0873791.1 biopolymer transporter ExbD [Vibrio parahaemolyticus O3]EJG0902449.1 biopolymer transporter ExbD [Vibrio parahaemolyticu
MIKVPQDNNRNGLTPDLTPLLDIIFIVMVFLMLTAAVKLDSLDVALPSTDSQAVAEVDKQSITVNILKDEPYWAINGQTYIDWENFTLALLEESKSTDKPIVIGAEKTANIQSLVQLLGFLQENGIQATQLLTEESP